MRDSWEYELAKEIKKDRSKPVTGPCIGVVISTAPFQVQIQNNNFILDKKNAYVCNQLLSRSSKFEAEGEHTQEGILNGADYTAEGSMTLEGEIELDAVWNAGDKVLVVPTGDGQKFFIVDIIREV